MFNDSYQYLLSLYNLPRQEYMRDPGHNGRYMERLQFLLDILGNPEKNIPHYIHITGTSGKGSVTTFLNSILSAANKKSAANLSPHPSIITERWKVGNKYMSKKDFITLVEWLKPKLNQYSLSSPYDMPSFFEITEAMGLKYFSDKKVQWLVTEVACGGRYDATNIIPKKDIAVITNIGLDHVGIIGNNLEEIAYEKAGIIKSGTAVFTTEKNPKLLKIIKSECDLYDCPLTIINNPKYKIIKIDETGTKFIYQNETYSLKSPGEHQVVNAVLVIEIAKSIGISLKAVKLGLSAAQQPLRMEIVNAKPLVILDGAHNTDKIKTTVLTAKSLFKSKNYKDLHLTVGFSKDKNYLELSKMLSSLKPKTISITRSKTNIERKVASPREMYYFFKKYCRNAELNIDLEPIEAYKWSLKKAQKTDIILVTGSIYISGEIRGWLFGKY